MKCYICAKEGIDSEAVGICVVCGMGICMNHLVREDVPVEDIVNWGLGQEKYTYPLPLPRILCHLCYEAIKQRKKG